MIAKENDPIQEIVARARRAQILDAAASVFSEKGFHRATIRQVAQTAGIADGTIYNYFENKADLLIGLINRLDEIDYQEEQFNGLSQAEFRTVLAALLRQRVTLYLPNIALFKAILPEVLVNPDLRNLYYQDHIVPFLEGLDAHLAARAQGGHVRQMDNQLTARAMVAMLIGLLVLYIMEDETLAAKADDLPDALTALLYDGIKPLTEQNKE